MRNSHRSFDRAHSPTESEGVEDVGLALAFVRIDLRVAVAGVDLGRIIMLVVRSLLLLSLCCAMVAMVTRWCDTFGM